MSEEFATAAAPALLDFASTSGNGREVKDDGPACPSLRMIFKASAISGFADLAILAPFGVITLLLERKIQGLPAAQSLPVIVLGVCIFVIVAAIPNYLGERVQRRTRTQCIYALLLWALAVVGVYAFCASPLSSAGVSSVWAVAWFVFGSLSIVGSRFALRDRVLAACNPTPSITRVALVGSASETQQLCAFMERPEQRLQYTVAGVFIDDAVTSRQDDLGVFETADTLPFVIGALKVDMVIAAPPWGDPVAMNRMCERLRAVPANVHLLTEIAEINPVPLARQRRFAGRIMVELWTLPLATWRAGVKRAEDIVISLALLTVLAPLMALIALVIRLETPGPVIFRQLRYGFANRPIRVSKFRTMRHNFGDATGAWGTVRNDPRVTRFGMLLRRTSLDELPQLFDVLRGDMSLVGPRAHPVEMRVDGLYYADAVRSYAARHLVKPGVTGLAQINGCRGHVNTRAQAERRVKFDLQYIETWSLFLDIRILWRSVFVGFIHENAY